MEWDERWHEGVRWNEKRRVVLGRNVKRKDVMACNVM